MRENIYFCNLLNMLSKGIIPIICIICFFSSCRKDETFLKGAGTLNFSTDTVYFDTVFTRIPGGQYPRSINKRFMIRNPYKETVKTNVRLAGGSTSPYRINVDGRSGINITDVEILPEDSAWVFVEATLEPNLLTQPSLVMDAIEFETNGNTQNIYLAAYGWDAYYFKDTVFSSNTSLLLTDKPYVIVNSAFVDSGVTLTIGPGVHVYNTPNSTYLTNDNKLITISALNVFGTLKINGNKSNPVIFEGDRLDNNYAEKSGQWRGIHYYRGSVNNTITHAIIKNATIGLWVDSLPENANPSLVIKNTFIRNVTAYGILGLTAKIQAENTVISNCGINTVLMYYGGDYDFRHCTFFSNTKDPHLIANNRLRNENKVVIKTYDLKYIFANCIVYTDGKDATAMFEDVDPNDPKFASAQSGYSFCLLRAKNTVRSDAGCIYNQDPKFVDVGKYNFKINTASPAKDKGRTDLNIFSDYDEKSRDSKPDMGAFEF
jgi:hypothetical protein